MAENQSFDNLLNWANYALAFLWLHTGVVSLCISPEIGYRVLATADIVGFWADFCVYAGGCLDIALGIWLLSQKWLRPACLVQMAVILLYSLLLSFIDASFWWHPFGPLTKNIPILVLIAIIYISTKPAMVTE